MVRLSRSSLLVVAIASLGLSASAAADPRPKSTAEVKEADRLVEEGKKLGEDGNPEAALEKFREAERLTRRPVHLCNIGIAYETMKNLPLALLYLERCREKADSFPKWLAAKHGEVIAELARTHAPVEIRVKPSKAKIRVSALGSDEPITSGERIFLPRGTWQVVAKRKGYTPGEATIEVSNLAGQRLSLSLDREPGAVAAEPDDVETTDEIDGSGGGGGRAAGWVVLGTGLVSAGVGGYFHLRSLDARDKARDLPPGPEFERTHDKYERDGWIAVGAYGVGAVCVGVGMYLLLRRTSEADEDPAVAVAIANGDVMLSFSLRH